MRRYGDWQSRLTAYLAATSERKFRYGQQDCGLFVAGAIEAMCGVDVAMALRGRYGSRREAFAAIAAYCGRSTIEAVAEHIATECGAREVPVLMAQRGDALLIRRAVRSSLGILSMMGNTVISPGRHGLLYLPLSCATRAWRIG